MVTLGASFLVQPLARRWHSPHSARGLVVALLLLTAGIALGAASVAGQSLPTALVACLLIGVGLGFGLVSALLEVQRIAEPGELAGLTGVFYAIAYSGFLVPGVVALVATAVPVPRILLGLSALALVCWFVVLLRSRAHLPDADPR